MSGVDLLTETVGEGTPAAKGDRVTFNIRIWLNRGEEVPLNALQSTHLPVEMVRIVDGDKFIDHTIILGKREAIAGLEHSLLGMKRGGYRKVRISPHLAYREKGIPGLIPPHAVLVVEVWLREVRQQTLTA